MGLSTRAVETLLDLVEIKLSCIEIYDREDSRELSKLEQCRDELLSIAGRGRGKSDLLGFPTRGRQQPA